MPVLIRHQTGLNRKGIGFHTGDRNHDVSGERAAPQTSTPLPSILTVANNAYSDFL